MVAEYLCGDFLLQSRTAKSLYHDHAATLPIIDFHNHLDPVAVAANHQFADLAELWIKPDPYKWRAMRINGVDERLITGTSTGFEKYQAWACTVPYTAANPLFHWTSLELKRYFGIEQQLNPQTAQGIWDRCDQQLQSSSFFAQALLKKVGVELLCTSDDLLDSLEPHRKMRHAGSSITMLPSLRADRLVGVASPGFAGFCQALGQQTNHQIEGLDAFMAAVCLRLDLFDELGCKLADVGLDQPVFDDVSDDAAGAIFGRLLRGAQLGSQELKQLKTKLLIFLAEQCHRRGWVLQLHVGAQRVTSQRLAQGTGAAGGYACIGPSSDIGPICNLLNALEARESLPRIILYTLNPSDMEMFASVTGSFTEAGTPGKVQFGPAWWFNDHRDGIVRQLKALGNLGLLRRHIGMTTDSRSLLSFSRHEYYRRILCNLVGEWVEAGELPRDADFLAGFITDICYNNARRWLVPEPARA